MYSNHDPAECPRTSDEIDCTLKGFRDKLLSALYGQWVEESLCDLQLQTFDGILHVHACVMVAFSPRIAATLLGIGSEDDTRPRERKMENWTRYSVDVPFEFSVIKNITEALYSGSFSVEFSLLDELCEAVEWLGIKELEDVIRSFKDKITGEKEMKSKIRKSSRRRKKTVKCAEKEIMSKRSVKTQTIKCVEKEIMSKKSTEKEMISNKSTEKEIISKKSAEKESISKISAEKEIISKKSPEKVSALREPIRKGTKTYIKVGPASNKTTVLIYLTDDQAVESGTQGKSDEIERKCERVDDQMVELVESGHQEKSDENKRKCERVDDQTVELVESGHQEKSDEIKRKCERVDDQMVELVESGHQETSDEIKRKCERVDDQMVDHQSAVYQNAKVVLERIDTSVDLPVAICHKEHNYCCEKDFSPPPSHHSDSDKAGDENPGKKRKNIPITPATRIKSKKKSSSSTRKSPKKMKKTNKAVRKKGLVLPLAIEELSGERLDAAELEVHFADGEFGASQVKLEIGEDGEYVGLKTPPGTQFDNATAQGLFFNEALDVFRCDECRDVFTDIVQYQEHVKNHRPTFPCIRCHRVFYSRANMTRHLRGVHFKPIHLKCSRCEFTAVEAQDYKDHCVSVHQDLKAFKCQFQGCKYMTNTYRYLSQHFERHETFRVIKCGKCDREFSSYYRLTRHKATCLKLGKYLCDFCGQSFNLLASMNRHRLNIHLGYKAFKCKVCSKAFSDGANLRRHMRVHNNTFPYSCSVCNRPYRHSNTLKQHMSTHNIGDGGHSVAGVDRDPMSTQHLSTPSNNFTATNDNASNNPETPTSHQVLTDISLPQIESTFSLLPVL